MTSIWDPIRVGNMELSHRFAMAPMTRSRAKPDGTPGELAAEYYAQRASLGLLISEGTQPSDDGQGYLNTPGIYTASHVAGWLQVADAIHAKGGHLFIQLMHVGRMAHPDNTPHHRQPVAPSAIAPGQKMFTASGMLDIPEPRALSAREITATVRDLAYAATQVIAAGADGVEIHAANGYLLHQFFAPNANVRSDIYGGGIENRARLAIDVAQAVAEAIGASGREFASRRDRRSAASMKARKVLSSIAIWYASWQNSTSLISTSRMAGRRTCSPISVTSGQMPCWSRAAIARSIRPPVMWRPALPISRRWAAGRSPTRISLSGIAPARHSTNPTRPASIPAANEATPIIPP